MQGATPSLQVEARPDGAVSPDGLVAGTYLHGVFESRNVRHAILNRLAAARGLT